MLLAKTSRKQKNYLKARLLPGKTSTIHLAIVLWRYYDL